MKYKNGYHLAISNAAYHASDGYSSSQLKMLLHQSPAHLKHTIDFPENKSSPSMLLGSAVHGLVLEPERFEFDFAILPELDLRTKYGRERKAEFLNEHSTATVIDYETYRVASMMAENLLANQTARHLLLNTYREVSIYWDDEIDTGLGPDITQLKCRPDAVGPNTPLILDIKTMPSVSLHECQRSIMKYGYHVSAAMYLEGLNSCPEFLDLLGWQEYEGFALLCVENKPPYATACYEMSADMLAYGRTLFLDARAKLADALTADFPSYPDRLRVVDLPNFTRQPDTL